MSAPDARSDASSLSRPVTEARGRGRRRDRRLLRLRECCLELGDAGVLVVVVVAAARNEARSLRRPRRRPARAGPLPSRCAGAAVGVVGAARALRRRGPGRRPRDVRARASDEARRRGAFHQPPGFGSATTTPGAPPMVMRSPTARSYVGAAAGGLRPPATSA